MEKWLVGEEEVWVEVAGKRQEIAHKGIPVRITEHMWAILVATVKTDRLWLVGMKHRAVIACGIAGK